MKAKGKNFVSLFLVLSLVALSGNLIAKEKTRNIELFIWADSYQKPAFESNQILTFHVPDSVFSQRNNLLTKNFTEISHWWQPIQSPDFFRLSNNTNLSEITDITKSSEVRRKPSLRSGRIVGEFLAGLGGGVILGYGTGILVGDAKGMFIGIPIGSAIGVKLVGNTSYETGNSYAAFIGSILGTVVGISVPMAIRGGKNGWDLATPMLLLSFVCSPCGAIIGFNITRRYTTPSASGTGFINFKNGQMSLSVPTISFHRNTFVKGDLIRTINLVEVSF